jgi:hypothetical protein
MDGHTASHIKAFDHVIAKDFVEGVSELMNEAHNEDLLRSDPSDDAADVHEHRCCGVEAADEGLLIDVDVIVAAAEAVDEYPFPEGTQQNVELGHEGVHEEGVGKGGPRRSLGEGHQIPEPDQHHHVHVLIGRVPV